MSKVVKLHPVQPPSRALTIEHLIESQKSRKFCITSQSRCDRAMDSFLASRLGYNPEATPAERKAVFKEAAKVRKAVESGSQTKLPASINQQVQMMILTSKQGRDSWDVLRRDTEAYMRKDAQQLPVYDFAQTVKGFGDLGLGIVIGETGDLSYYDGPAKVWKRLGLAVIYGQRQQRKTDPELAAQHGFNPRRRAEIWSLFSDSMFKHQWAGEARSYREALTANKKAAAYIEKHGIDLTKLKKLEELVELAAKFNITAQAHAVGPYGEIYGRRRQATAEREMRPMHSHADACRVMTKAVLCDLWRVWHGQLPRYEVITDERKVA